MSSSSGSVASTVPTAAPASLFSSTSNEVGTVAGKLGAVLRPPVILATCWSVKLFAALPAASTMRLPLPVPGLV